jgi:signal transduction histidine kinase
MRLVPRERRLRAYGLAVMAVAVATLVRWLLQPLLEQNLPFITFFGAAFLVAWWGGFGPTVVAVVLSAVLADALFLAPVTTSAQETLVSILGLGLFVAIGLATGIMGEQRLRAQSRAEIHAAEAARSQELAEETAAQAEEEAVRAEEEAERAEDEATRAAEALQALQRAQDELRQSQKMEAVGQLAGGVAHDFNNILTAIAGYTGFLLQDLPERDPKRADALGIAEAIDRAAALTQQLLAFSRKQVLQPTVVDVRELLEDTGRMLRRLIGEHIDLAIVTGPLLSPVLADRGQLSQVLVNLALNARDAMPMGGRLTMEARDMPLTEDYAGAHLAVESGDYVQLAVSDTGHGMTPEIQARIFEPFFTTKPREEGTGLGLSTVFGIVKQLGGHIFVYSEPGQGTTFKIYLPRAEAAGIPPVVPIPDKMQRGSETILLVEDDSAIRGVTVRMLNGWGYAVLAAATPREALDLAGNYQGEIHLLLTDVVLPEMTGPQLARVLLASRPGLSVLYMSGYTDTAMLFQGWLEAGTRFMQKPFTPAQLQRQLREVLELGGWRPATGELPPGRGGEEAV